MYIRVTMHEDILDEEVGQDLGFSVETWQGPPWYQVSRARSKNWVHKLVEHVLWYKQVVCEGLIHFFWLQGKTNNLLIIETGTKSMRSRLLLNLGGCCSIGLQAKLITLIELQTQR